MTGRCNGFVTLVSRQATHTIIRVWCGAHQLDLVVHRFFDNIMQKNFSSKILTLIGWMHRQSGFEKAVGSKCPTICSTRWSSLALATRWLRKHRSGIVELVNEKEPDFVLDALFLACTSPRRRYRSRMQQNDKSSPTTNSSHLRSREFTWRLDCEHHGYVR